MNTKHAPAPHSHPEYVTSKELIALELTKLIAQDANKICYDNCEPKTKATQIAEAYKIILDAIK